ncbi:MAG: hypothetical protein IT579_13695 [Verrucomicrobia subdivision 3 bacterium]|nr:hypothetical protein [Limisphaerales bacterium]
MGEQTALHKPFRIYLTVPTTPNDVVQTDSHATQDLPGHGDQDPDQQREPLIRKSGRTIEEKKEIQQRKQAIPVVKEKIADPDHHLTAMMPLKLYHLKKTSQ